MSIRNVLAGLVAMFFLAAAPANADWHEARSSHFVVYSDDKPQRVLEFTTRLERFDRALRSLFKVPAERESSSRQLTVYVVDDTSEVARLMGKGGRGTAGFYLPRATGALAFVPRRSGGDLSAEVVLLHEYAHHFMYTTWPNMAVPAWFSEGFAEFAATALFNKDGSVTIGSPPLYRVGEILDPSMWLKRIMTSNVETLPIYLKSQIYGRGWLLTHYLLLSSENRHLFSGYIDALNSGKSQTEAATAFGDLMALDKTLDRYATSRLSALMLKPEMLAIGKVSVAPLSPGAAAVMPALILSDRGVNAETAPAVYALAAKLAAPFPNDPFAQNVLAEAAFDAKDLAVATAAADRALAADPQSIHALIYRGRIAMRQAALDQSNAKGQWSGARKYFLAANKLDTENAEPLFLYFQTFVAAGEAPTKNAQAALAYAYELVPFDPNMRLSAATLFLQQGNGPAARQALKPIAYSAHGGPLRSFAEKVMTTLDQDGSAAALALMKTPQSDPQTDDS